MFKYKLIKKIMLLLVFARETSSISRNMDFSIKT